MADLLRLDGLGGGRADALSLFDVDAVATPAPVVPIAAPSSTCPACSSPLDVAGACTSTRCPGTDAAAVLPIGVADPFDVAPF